jgi:hypothetical protein
MPNPLLWLAARPRMPADLVPTLDRAAHAVDDWSTLLIEAERHGIGPLLHRHLHAAGIAVPEHPRRQLQGLYLRHRAADGVRTRALVEILEAFAADGIEVRLLKGSALSRMRNVYADPALRPASDIDLLVSKARILDAWRTLERLGLRAMVPAAAVDTVHHRHLPTLSRSREGLLVQVDLHHDAMSGNARTSLMLDEHREPPAIVDVAGRRAPALGLHEMLWHACEHFVGDIPGPMRLIWVADILGYAEAYACQLDWTVVLQRFPIVLNVLDVLSHATAMPDILAQHTSTASSREPREGFDFLAGWPTSAGAGTPWTRLHRMLAPPAWWMNLRYGRRRRPMTRLTCRLRHTAVVGRVVHRRTRGALAAHTWPSKEAP